MKNRCRIGLSLLILFVCSVVPGAYAQIATTSVRGEVKDPAGALIPGAEVTLEDTTNAKVRTMQTSGAGVYQFLQIPPSKYKITVRFAGFADQSKAVELLVNQPATIDFDMAVRSEVTVDVSASAQVLNLTDATIGNSVNNAMIQAVPMDGRDPVSLLSLQPGVLFLGTATDSRTGSVSGGRSDQGNVTLDGIDDNDQVNGTAFKGVLRSTMDSTEEFRVTTASSNADAGRSSGAQVSLITKSGTNKFHGALYEYYRGSFSHANDWFNKQSELASGEANKPVKYVQNVFGGSIGGPILKDKLFFFFNYEGFREAINSVVTETVPTASFKAGQVGYTDVNGNTQFLSRNDIATLDAGCTQCSAPGVNQAILDYYSAVPAATTFSVGDGINSGGFTFSSPNPKTLNTSIAKLDYDFTPKQHLFFRGNLQKDVTAGSQQFPGQPASTTTEDNSKGYAIGHLWTPSAHITNDVRYGFVRQGYSNRGIGQGDYVFVRFLNQPTAQTRTSIVSVPVHNITDNFSYNLDKHTIQLGGTWRMITNNTGTDSNSFSGASTNPYWLKGGPPDPSGPPLNKPAVSDGFANSYLIAYSTIVGNVPSYTGQYNYAVTSPTEAGLLPDGAFIDRHFRTNEFEYYIQDAWHATPNLTITFGIRHSLLATPYETAGQQIAPTTNTHDWFMQRGIAAAQGKVYEPDLFFTPAGAANHRPGYWPRQKLNIAPRFALVYSPDSKTVIRAGADMYYDHYGQSIAQRFSEQGSFGLSTSLGNPAGVYTNQTSPRFTGPHDMPNINVGTPDPKQVYPYAPPDGLFAITWGADSRLKTPYAESFTFSVQRELGAGFTLETNYVGRLGRHLLQQLDLAEPVNYVDPQGTGDYFTAATQLTKLTDERAQNPDAQVPTIPYFESVFPQMKGLDYAGESATQAIYTNEWAANRATYGATSALADLDFYCYYGCPNGSLFWQSQFSSLYSWSSIGMSYYNAGQLILRHPSRNGLSMDFNYTLAKSIDMGSDSERSDFFAGSGGGFGPIQNSWNPALNRAVSDFDVRHLISADWAYALPVGRGAKFLPGANRLLDAVVGGWQLAGLARWNSGLPFSVYEPGWTTNWELEGWGVNVQKVKTRKHIDPQSGSPQVFDDPDAINNGINTGAVIRLPYPGEAGQRNPFRGDGLFNLDSSLSKTWSLIEGTKLKFAWEVYNVTNTQPFDTYSINTNLTQGSLGNYSGVLNQYRRMQFGLRLDF